MSKDPTATIKDFREAVNMTAKQIEKFLDTPESQEVGQKKAGEDSESTGHASGRRIIELLGKKRDDYSDDDLKHMAKVVSYVHRHSKQRPEGEIKETPWRYSLMNWGHDPLKDKA